MRRKSTAQHQINTVRQKHSKERAPAKLLSWLPVGRAELHSYTSPLCPSSVPTTLPTQACFCTPVSGKATSRTTLTQNESHQKQGAASCRPSLQVATLARSSRQFKHKELGENCTLGKRSVEKTSFQQQLFDRKFQKM